MFISTAFAATGVEPTSGDFIMSLVPILLIFVVFYFLLLRPQQKRMKAHKALIDDLKKGDKIVTGGGSIATVKKIINDHQVAVEVSKGVEITVVRGTIQGLWTMPEPLAPIKK